MDAQTQGKVQQIGNYRLDGKIGQGGMGLVFKATDLSLDRTVALKVLAPKFAQDERSLQRFLREAKSAGRLQHRNIVVAYDVGQSPEGHYYLAMELVEGESLRDRIKRQGALDQREATAIVLEVARGLQHAEGVGMVHRDIKPDNILIDQEGTPKIADFGLAKTEEDPLVTQAGGVVGSPNYMSPEQARGAQGIDSRTDIYSLGATYYHLIVGRPPFEGETAAVIMAQHLNQAAPLAHEQNALVSEHTSRVIHKMMAKDPDARYRTVGELIEELERLLAGEAPAAVVRSAAAAVAARTQRTPPGRRAAPRSPGKLLAVVCAAALLTVAAGAALLYLSRADRGEEAVSPRTARLNRSDKTGNRRAAMDLGKQGTAPEASLLEGRAARALESAELFALKNSEDLAGQLRRYGQVVADYHDTLASSKAAELIRAVEAKWDEEATEVMIALRQQAGDLLDRKEYGKALELWGTFPQKLRNDRWSGEVERQQRACTEAAWSAYRDLEEQSRQLEGKAELVKAKKALEPAQSFGVGEITRQAQAAIEKLEQRIAAAELEAQKKSAAALDELVAKVNPLLADRNYQGAMRVIEHFQESRPEIWPEQIREVRLFVEELSQFWAAIESGAGKLEPGETCSLRGTRGKFVKYEEGRIIIDVGGPQMGRRLDELKSSELLALAGSADAGDAGEAELQLALFLVSDKEPDPGAARRHFDAAAQEGVDTGPYQRLFESLEEATARDETATVAESGGKKGGAERETKTRGPSRSQVLAMIEKAGRAKPDWWDDVEMLRYPESLDLTWPKPQRGWNEQRNVGQYLWGVMSRDPNQWKSAAKFIHHVLKLNRRNPDGAQRAMVSLAQTYGDRLEDYARGAYWYQRRLKDGEMHKYDMTRLAHCYWKLGSRDLAKEALRKIGADEARTSLVSRLYADMGYHDKALQVASGISETEGPAFAFLAAANAHWHAGKFDKAEECYRRVLGLDLHRGNRWLRHAEFRARAGLEAAGFLKKLDLSKIPDGTYHDCGPWIDGQICVEVSIKAGRIAACQVSRHQVRYLNNALFATPREIVEKGVLQDIETCTSNAEITEAILIATAKALGRARERRQHHRR